MSAARAILRALPRQTARRVTVAPLVARPALRTTAAPAARHASTLPPRANFTKVSEEHVKALRGLLASHTSLLSTLDGTASTDELVAYNDDWMNKYHGKSQVVVKPKTTQEVSAVLKYCHDNNIAVVPQGGNTGLVGTLFEEAEARNAQSDVQEKGLPGRWRSSRTR